MPVPILAQMLFTSINEQEAALARVSKLLHDDVSQVLSAVGLQLDAMKMDFSKQAPGMQPARRRNPKSAGARHRATPRHQQ